MHEQSTLILQTIFLNFVLDFLFCNWLFPDLRTYVHYFDWLTVSRGALPADVRKHQSTRTVVVHRANIHLAHNRILANATFEEFLRSQEISVILIS